MLPPLVCHYGLKTKMRQLCDKLGASFRLYSPFNIKKSQRDWDKFFDASVGIGTASKKNLSQSRTRVLCIDFSHIEYSV